MIVFDLSLMDGAESKDQYEAIAYWAREIGHLADADSHVIIVAFFIY